MYNGFLLLELLPRTKVMRFFMELYMRRNGNVYIKNNGVSYDYAQIGLAEDV